MLQELGDDDLDAPSLLTGWSRRMLIAHVGYNARGLARLTQWARTGTKTPMYDSDSQRWDEIVSGASLPPQALRHLFEHSAIHLNVEWRDLEDSQWDASVVTAQGRTVPARETTWMRAKEVWVHAVDLGTRGSFADFPPEMIDGIIDDVLRVWNRRDERLSLLLRASDRPAEWGERRIGTGGPVVEGRAVDIARWLARGRAHGLRRVDGDDLPDIPRWF
ncbi:maleylpyruvate isomerase family mycothiol-dependent enzyme [Microbacterium sp. MAHUQ-60]|uniref:maleylpyruvate isomerase family mycothiol-dependent enzyme n=1 Tax=unclassified Microbacterium TaxID=2609290 RepID=UPI003618504F